MKLIDADALEREGLSLCRTYEKDKATMVYEVKKPNDFPTVEEPDVPDTNVGDIISKQDAINALGEEPEVWTEKDEYAQGLNNQWHYDRNAIKALPSAQPEQRWIPVTERLPEKNGNYLITHRLPWKSETGEDRYEVDMDYWQWNTWDDDNDVVAWMPLPEPYKGEVKE